MSNQLTVSISIDDQASSALKRLMSALGDSKREELHGVAARVEVENFREYHREFQAQRGWDKPALPTHGSGRKRSRFGEDVSRAWAVLSVDDGGFTLSNDATGFAHKVTGGTIRAKRAGALTIPMVPEAHGVRARNYPGELFRPKGKAYLMELRESGEARIVYLLRKSVTQKAWKGALPDLDAAASRVAGLLGDLILEEVDGGA